jgi:prolyl-tRNA editing enzyme YbaK/EbsC (Cys-tRNA(Pro) deacylase)
LATGVCCAGGRGLELELGRADLVRAAGASVAPIGKA